jgi:malate synthase
MGGMSAVLPAGGGGQGISTDVINKIVADKKHEQLHGAQGAWVAHPALVPTILKMFTADKSQVKPLPVRSVPATELIKLEESLKDVSKRSEGALR